MVVIKISLRETLYIIQYIQYITDADNTRKKYAKR